MKLNRSTIWNCRQNKPTQIVHDLIPHIEGDRPGSWGARADLIYGVLLKRGVFKWLAVRRDLIRLKNEWKERLKAADFDGLSARRKGNRYRDVYMRGYRQALLECRMEVRALCHSDRWQAPDHDRAACRWLDAVSEGYDANPDAEIETPAVEA